MKGPHRDIGHRHHAGTHVSVCLAGPTVFLLLPASDIPDPSISLAMLWKVPEKTILKSWFLSALAQSFLFLMSTSGEPVLIDIYCSFFYSRFIVHKAALLPLKHRAGERG